MNDLVPIKETQDISEIFFKSGLFSDVRTASQAMVKVMAGRELGLKPFASMSAFDIIEGNVAPSGNLIASLIRSSPKYDYRIKTLNKSGCILCFYLKKVDGSLGECLGETSFTEEDAKAAELAGRKNYQRFKEAMFFNRAITKGQKMHCPDLTHGIKLYTPEELQPDRAIDLHDVEVVEEYCDNQSRLQSLMSELGLTNEEVSALFSVPMSIMTNPTEEQAKQLVSLLEVRKSVNE